MLFSIVSAFSTAKCQEIAPAVANPPGDSTIKWRASATVSCKKTDRNGVETNCLKPKGAILDSVEIYGGLSSTMDGADISLTEAIEKAQEPGGLLYSCKAGGCNISVSRTPAKQIAPGAEGSAQAISVNCGRHRVQCFVTLANGDTIYVVGGGRTLKAAWADLHQNAREISEYYDTTVKSYSRCVRWRLPR